MDMDSMFYCIPQQAYLSVTTCKNLRERPVGKAPAGAQPKLIACEKCTMHPLVDMSKRAMECNDLSMLNAGRWCDYCKARHVCSKAWEEAI